MYFELQKIEDDIFRANYQIETDLGFEKYSFGALLNSDDNLNVSVTNVATEKNYTVVLEKMPEYRGVDRSKLEGLNTPELEEGALEEGNFPIRSDKDIHLPRNSSEGRIIAEMAYIHKLVDEGRAVYDFDHGPYFMP